MSGERARPPFRLYGHRGAAAHHPENTMRSFRAAIAAGADAVETDVRLTSDGVVAVFHDADGVRTCHRAELLRDCPWSEVSTWDAGEGERPVTLRDLLEALPELFVNVDVKDADPAAALATLAVVREAQAEDRVGLGSFHEVVPRVLRAAGWRGQLALSPREVAAVRLLPLVACRPLVRGTAAQIPVAQLGFRLDQPRFLRRCREIGLRVDYWTIDDPDQAVALVRAGADGIVTNDPARVRAALRVTTSRIERS